MGDNAYRRRQIGMLSGTGPCSQRTYDSGIAIDITDAMDQVNALAQMGVPAAYINSSLGRDEYIYTMRAAAKGRYRILYVAPERLAAGIFS